MFLIEQLLVFISFYHARAQPTVSVDEISGIGNVRSEKLREKGIYDIETFLKTDNSLLSEILGLSDEIIKRKKVEGELLLES